MLQHQGMLLTKHGFERDSFERDGLQAVGKLRPFQSGFSR